MPKGWPNTGNCHYCRRFSVLTRDHIVPRARGGTNYRWNLVGSCGPCNSRKADTLPTCSCDYCQDAIDLHWQWLCSQTFADQRVLSVKVAALYENRWQSEPVADEGLHMPPGCAKVMA